MDIAQAQQRAYRLITLATDQPNTPEGQNAAMAACRLIRESGLLISKPADIFSAPAPLPAATPPPATSAKRRRKRPNAKAIAEDAVAAADTVVSAVDAAGRVVSAFNGFSQVLRGR